MKRFDEFIQISENLNNMEKDIMKCLNHIQYLKSFNKTIQNENIQKCMIVLSTKKNIVNIQKTIHLVNYLKLKIYYNSI